MIGVFDSGMGGLSAVAAIRRLSPESDILYFGDTARNPYGTRPPEVVLRYAESAVAFLEASHADIILSACGTVSAVALDTLKKTCRVPLHGVLLPAVEEAGSFRRVAVLATPLSIKTHAFRDALRAKKTRHIFELPCPFFVPMVENGLTNPHDPIVKALVVRTLAPLFRFYPDCIILGCTHFPFLSEAIAALFPNVVLVNASLSAARAILPHKAGSGRLTLCFSAMPEGLLMPPFGKDLEGAEIRKTTLDSEGNIQLT